MTTDELIERLTDICRTFVWAAKIEPACQEKAWQELIKETEPIIALARQHKGGWRHLDRDAEKPETHSVCLTWHPEWGVRVSLIGTTGNFDEPYNPCWWMPLPAPPKE